jgi:hypothetical protein
LQNSRVHRGDDTHRGIKFFLGHPRFPCVRKAPIHSWITESHHRDGETDEHLLALDKKVFTKKAVITSPVFIA